MKLFRQSMRSGLSYVPLFTLFFNYFTTTWRDSVEELILYCVRPSINWSLLLSDIAQSWENKVSAAIFAV